MTTPTPQPGDEVLIRARVLSGPTDSGNVLGELAKMRGPFVVNVRRDLIAEVIPAERTKTHAGNTVADTREAIGMADRMIAKRVDRPGSPANAVIVAKLREMRAELVADLEAIDVPVEEGP